jgi:hypothetical protein
MVDHRRLGVARGVRRPRPMGSAHDGRRCRPDGRHRRSEGHPLSSRRCRGRRPARGPAAHARRCRAHRHPRPLATCPPANSCPTGRLHPGECHLDHDSCFCGMGHERLPIPGCQVERCGLWLDAAAQQRPGARAQGGRCWPHQVRPSWGTRAPTTPIAAMGSDESPNIGAPRPGADSLDRRLATKPPGGCRGYPGLLARARGLTAGRPTGRP